MPSNKKTSPTSSSSLTSAYQTTPSSSSLAAQVPQYEASKEKHIQVIFKTNLPFKVAETPFTVPITFSRFRLSEFVNHLLSLEPSRMFDFLISNEFLRGTLEEYTKRNQIKIEEVILTLQYVEVTPKPKPQKTLSGPDWVSSIFTMSTNEPSYFISGSYDQKVRVWDESGECVITIPAHNDPVTSVAASKEVEGEICVASTSQDHLVKTWQVNLTAKTYDHSKTLHFKGHSDTTTCVAFNPRTSHFCSGSWDKSILLWSRFDEDTILLDDDDDSQKKKKRKKNEPNPIQEPKLKLEGHTQPISKLHWQDQYTILSSSWDHSLRIWDVSSAIATSTMNGPQVINDMSASSSLIATAHPDRAIRLWDTRSSSYLVKKMVSHKLWVSSVCWHPTVDYLILSTSYDNDIKLWDIRSHIALHTFSGHTDKILCSSWNGKNYALTGGADSKIIIHKQDLTEDCQVK